MDVSGVGTAPTIVASPVVPRRSFTDVQAAFKHANSFKAVKTVPPVFVRFRGTAKLFEVKNSSSSALDPVKSGISVTTNPMSNGRGVKDGSTAL